MKKLLLILLCLPMIGFGQEVLDTIFYRDWSIKTVNIIEVNESNIVFHYPNETIKNTESLNEISKLIFSSGRVQNFNKTIGLNPDTIERKKNDRKLKINTNRGKNIYLSSGMSLSRRSGLNYKKGSYFQIGHTLTKSKLGVDILVGIVEKGYNYNLTFTDINGYVYSDGSEGRYESRHLSTTLLAKYNFFLTTSLSIELGTGPRFDFFINDRQFIPDDISTNFLLNTYVVEDDPDINKFIYGFDSKLRLNYFTNKMFYGLSLSSYNNLNKVAYHSGVRIEQTFIFSLSLGYKL